jgi:hypothetical protein
MRDKKGGDPSERVKHCTIEDRYQLSLNDIYMSIATRCEIYTHTILQLLPPACIVVDQVNSVSSHRIRNSGENAEAAEAAKATSQVRLSPEETLLRLQFQS